jgi:CBS domain-containing protein
MRATTKSFLALTAADLMTAPVTTIPQDMSLQDAARLLCQSSISGAPVVDAEGRCLGVISSSDFVTCVGERGEPGEKGPTVSFIAPWREVIKIEDFPDDDIGRYMTAQPVTVAPETPIGEMAQTVIDAHIHRVLVVVDQHRPCGIVTSTDILAAVAGAARKASQEGANPRGRARSRR